MFKRWKESLRRSRIQKDVNTEIKYKAEDVDYWQTPKETMKLGTADCEGYAILKADRIGLAKCSIIIGWVPGGLHAMCRDERGKCYDLKGSPKKLKKMNFKPECELFFDGRVMKRYTVNKGLHDQMNQRFVSLLNRMREEL